MATFSYTVRLGTGVTPTVLVEKGRNHVKMLEGNPAFTEPTPKLTDITAQCDELDKANQAFDFNRGKVEKQTRDTLYRELKAMIQELAGYVQANCKGDRDLILSTGFDVRKKSEPIGDLTTPQNVRVAVSVYPRRLDVAWDGVYGKKMYQLWMTDGDPLDAAGWKLLLQTTRNRYKAEGLESNKVYSFRVVALGTAGPSPVSNIAAAKAA
jgi:hypothetical protein